MTSVDQILFYETPTCRRSTDITDRKFHQSI